MTRGNVELPNGVRLTISMGPQPEARCQSYYARIERPDGSVRILAGSAPTYREAWDAVLQAVESAVREAA